MSDVTIKTNRRWRDLVYRHDVPAKVLADQFDYQDAEDIIDGFLCYRGRWYHLDQFTRSSGGPLAEWDGVHNDSYFSGIAIKVSQDGERYQVATFYS